MPTYVTLLKWTDQGIRSAKETVNRSEQAQRAAEQMGGRLTTIFWTQGAYDIVAISEFPDDETYTAFMLATGMQGNLRTETLRGFNADEMRRILEKLPS